jgi:hypothetical protein
MIFDSIFEYLDSRERFKNNRTHFEFAVMFAVLCTVVIGGAAFLIFLSLRDDGDARKPVFITDLDHSVNLSAKHHQASPHTAASLHTAKRHVHK